MFAHIRRNTVAYLALFLSLGGTGYAAVRIEANSIDSRHLRSGSVGSSEVKDRSLKGSDFARGVLRPGPIGPAGPSGTAGPQGAPGAPGTPGARGPTGPTDGVSTDSFTEGALEVDFVIDATGFTTATPGRLSVTKGVGKVLVDCGGGGFWHGFLVVDGKRVPGVMLKFVNQNEAIPQVIVSGVTTATLPAGEHTAGLGVDCPFTKPGESSAHVFQSGGGASAVILG